MDKRPKSPAVRPTTKPERTIPVYPDGLWPGEGEDSDAALRRQERDGMGWRFHPIDDWDTDKIFDTLHGLGIDADVHRFRDEARAHRTIESLAEAWCVGFPDHDLWEDFPYIAAGELWGRLAADIPAPELVADRIEECGDLLGVLPPDASALALRISAFVEYLEQFEPKVMRRRYVELEQYCIFDIPAVLADAIHSLGRHDLALAERLLAVARTSGIPCGPFLAMALAEMLRLAGRLDDARDVITRAIADFPDLPGPYEAAMAFSREIGDYPTMAEYAVQALMRTSDLDEWERLESDITDDFEELGLPGELADVLRRTHRLGLRPSGFTGRDAHPALGARDVDARVEAEFREAPVRGAHNGRNKPCPCGSGKKYKKCHGQ
jgi:hypothetical protein